jgi:hypothetical protein
VKYLSCLRRRSYMKSYAERMNPESSENHRTRKTRRGKVNDVYRRVPFSKTCQIMWGDDRFENKLEQYRD